MMVTGMGGALVIAGERVGGGWSLKVLMGWLASELGLMEPEMDGDDGDDDESEELESEREVERDDRKRRE